MSLFQRIPDLACQTRAFSPLFNFVDDHSYHAQTQPKSSQAALSLNRSSDFFASFDVRENNDAYELQGELPGVEKEEISVEFTAENTLTITGNKERRHISRIPEDNEVATISPDGSDDDWQEVQRVSESIDAATIGPVKGRRRTSILDSRQWQRPTQDIDSWSQVHTHERTERRPSIVNAKERGTPSENIDSWSGVHTKEKTTRRPSVVNAKTRREPAESIDASAAVHHEERARRRPSVVNASGTWKQPAFNIDAATSGPVRATAMTAVNGVAKENIDAATTFVPPTRPLAAPRTQSLPQYQQWVLPERPIGPFWREFKFPAPVDRNGVKASLKGGILTVAVPKRNMMPESRMVIAVN